RERSWRPLARLGAATLLAFFIWLILNPVYWSDPQSAFQETVVAREHLLTAQTNNSPLTYANFPSRVDAIVSEPFIENVQYYEAPNWVSVIDDQISTYDHSVLSGWHWGRLIGVGFTLLAGIGLVSFILKALQRNPVAYAILIWVSASMLAEFVIP